MVISYGSPGKLIHTLMQPLSAAIAMVSILSLEFFFNFSFHSMALTWFFSYVLFLSFLSYFFDTFQISICWSVLKICHRTSLFLPILSSWLTFASSWFYIPFRCCKESACNGGDLSWIPALGRSPGEGNGNPLQYSSLGNSMDRGSWWAMVHRVAKSWKELNRLSTQTST